MKFAAEPTAQTMSWITPPRRRTIGARLKSWWAECALALAMGAALVFSGCRAYCWTGPDGRQRITSDPPEAYPPEERVNVHPGEWR